MCTTESQRLKSEGTKVVMLFSEPPWHNIQVPAILPACFREGRNSSQMSVQFRNIGFVRSNLYIPYPTGVLYILRDPQRLARRRNFPRSRHLIVGRFHHAREPPPSPPLGSDLNIDLDPSTNIVTTYSAKRLDELSVVSNSSYSTEVT